LIREKLEQQGTQCQCIRCREVRNKKVSKVELVRRDYEASGGKEVFLSFEDPEKNLLVGFARLRQPFKPFRPEITPGTVGIRELRVYGPEVDVGEKDWKKQQHRGYGRDLLREAEKIAVEDLDAKKILVTSGVGAREYYRLQEYKQEGAYMSKVLKS
jgi:elongator complex protein 3